MSAEDEPKRFEVLIVDGKTVRVAAVIYGARDLGNLIAKITA